MEPEKIEQPEKPQAQASPSNNTSNNTSNNPLKKQEEIVKKLTEQLQAEITKLQELQEKEEKSTPSQVGGKRKKTRRSRNALRSYPKNKSRRV